LHGPGSPLLHLIAAIIWLSGCAQPATGQALGDHTPVPAASPRAPVPTPTAPAAQPTRAADPQPTQSLNDLWISGALPAGLRQNLALPGGLALAGEREGAALRLEIPTGGTEPAPQDGSRSTHWIYVVAAPFPTLVDEVREDDLRRAWAGRAGGPFQGAPLLAAPETLAALEAWWGPAHPKGVRAVDPAALLETAWADAPAWAILPFEAIEPRWKVLRLDGQSPLERAFEPASYPLAVPVRLSGSAEALRALPPGLDLPTNRDPARLTVLVMTGVTALSRHIGEVMEEKGVTYPARSIRAWLAEADLTHVSNEVSFYTGCPQPGPLRRDMRFCSHPRYIRLLEAVGTDVVELTGNHNLDWGFQPYLDTLDMYRERGWQTFGGGANLEEARRPLFIEHNGNRLVFLGCSPAGPQPVWATVDEPGSAPCQMAELEEQVRGLRAGGALPVVTLQAFEADTYQPPPAQGAPDFRRLARAGAVIVSGSQAHIPQTMTFVDSSFVHYGLGNLFFDQMTPPEARQQFIDRHVFYDGRYLGVELLTTLLEETARPRPMTPKERSAFLQEIFSLSDWSGE
jgi:poly-gamma-glutamate synthesis protein (capsule biosynthesis protein)